MHPKHDIEMYWNVLECNGLFRTIKCKENTLQARLATFQPRLFHGGHRPDKRRWWYAVSAVGQRPVPLPKMLCFSLFGHDAELKWTPWLCWHPGHVRRWFPIPVLQPSGWHHKFTRSLHKTVKFAPVPVGDTLLLVQSIFFASGISNPQLCISTDHSKMTLTYRKEAPKHRTTKTKAL